MWKQYCSWCESSEQDEFVLLEYEYAGDWVWFHEPCGEQSISIIDNEEEE